MQIIFEFRKIVDACAQLAGPQFAQSSQVRLSKNACW